MERFGLFGRQEHRGNQLSMSKHDPRTGASQGQDGYVSLSQCQWDELRATMAEGFEYLIDCPELQTTDQALAWIEEQIEILERMTEREGD